MQSKLLRLVINPTLPALIFFVILSSFFWGLSFVGNYFSQDTMSFLSKDFLRTSNWEFSVAVYLITLFNAFLLAQLIHKFSSFKRTKGFLPAFVFVVLTTSWGNAVVLPIQTHLSLTFFILSLGQFLQMDGDSSATENAFLGSFLCGIAVSLFNLLIFLLPIICLFFFVLNCFSLRTFLASLMGFFCPILFYCFVAYSFFDRSFDSFLFDIDFSLNLYFESLSTVYVFYSSIMALLLIFCFIETIKNVGLMQNQGRRYATLSFCFLFLILFFCFFQKNHRENFLPFLVFSYALCFSWGFSVGKGRLHAFLLLIFLIANSALVIYNFFA